MVLGPPATASLLFLSDAWPTIAAKLVNLGSDRNRADARCNCTGRFVLLGKSCRWRATADLAPHRAKAATQPKSLRDQVRIAPARLRHGHLGWTFIARRGPRQQLRTFAPID